MCIEPVGDGAMRVTTVIGDSGSLRAGGAGALSTRLKRAATRAPARVGAWARAEVEAQAERWALWSPVAFGAGAAIYFGLPREPWAPAFVAMAVLAMAAAVAARLWGRSRALAILAALVAFDVCGFAAGVVKTRIMAAPVAPESRKPVTVEGWVIDVASATADKPRLLIAPTRVGDLPWRDTPVRIRVALRDGALVGPGAPVRLSAILGPPPSPAAPGAYDFARDAWFSQVGGSGLALRAPEVIALPPPPRALRLAMAVNAARWSLARRLVDRMGEREGGLAAALTTGHQAWLQETDVQAMRDSGLAHILSISGVHMAIVGGFVFALVRLGIAAWPWAALRVPGKKVAAGAALAALVAYLVLSGAPPPAIRSALTAGIALVAVMLDRRALTLHSLAIAALVVLVVQPEAIVQPGFQMSFAATAALLALAEAWPHATSDRGAPRVIRAAQKARGWLVAGAAVSLVAGLATDPFAIQHFNRVALWSVPANLGAELLSSFVVMPALAMGAVAESFGWGAPFLAVAGWGLDGIAATAALFARLPHAVVGWPSAPALALPTSFLGLLVVCLLRTPLRLLGLPLFVAVWLWSRPPTPVAWIAEGGANVAVADGARAVLLRPRSQRFGFELWAHRRGLAFADDTDGTPPADPRWTCGRDSCAPGPQAPLAVAGWWRLKPATPEDAASLCAGARIVVLRTGSASSSPACAGRLVLDEDGLAAGGAAEVFREGAGFRVRWAQDARGDRPWSRAGG